MGRGVFLGCGAVGGCGVGLWLWGSGAVGAVGLWGCGLFWCFGSPQKIEFKV